MNPKTLSYLVRRSLSTLTIVAVLAATALAQREEAFPFNGTNGSSPQGGLVADAAGNLYGTTYGGGMIGALCASVGCGLVYEMSPPAALGGKWTETTLYEFLGAQMAVARSAIY